MTHLSKITIPTQSDWRVLVKTGSSLTLETSVAQTGGATGEAARKDTSKSHVIPLAKTLSFSPDKIFKFLKKSIGQEVKKGDVVAAKSGVLSHKKFVSEFSGIITSINHHTGDITIEEHPESISTDIPALVVGTVDSVGETEIHVKVKEVKKVTLAVGLHRRIGARVLITANEKASALTLPEVAGSVVVVPQCAPYVLAKLEALGASFIITDATSSHSDKVRICGPEESASETLSTIVDFAPHYLYADVGSNDVLFYK